MIIADNVERITHMMKFFKEFNCKDGFIKSISSNNFYGKDDLKITGADPKTLKTQYILKKSEGEYSMTFFKDDSEILFKISKTSFNILFNQMENSIYKAQCRHFGLEHDLSQGAV